MFIPFGKRKAENNISGHVLLLLDNAPAYPSADSLPQDEDIDVMFTPSNVTSILHPLDQNVIETFKRLYHKSFLLYLLALSKNEKGSKQLIKEFSLKESPYMIGDAWDSVKTETF